MTLVNSLLKASIAFALLSFSFLSNAQKGIDLGFSLGVSAYQGDLAPSSLRGAVGKLGYYSGLFIAVRPLKWVELEVQSNVGQLSADDRNQLNESRRLRNLHFKSSTLDYGIKLNFLLPIYWSNHKHLISPYAGIGYSRIHFNPKARDDYGRWVDLQPLRTEGQGLDRYPDQTPYSLSTHGAVLSAGIRYFYSSGISIRVEGAVHTTQTDYLDDVSTSYPDLNYLEEIVGGLARDMSYRGLYESGPGEGAGRGNPNENDWFISLQVKIGYTITFASLSDNRNRRKVLCPRM